MSDLLPAARPPRLRYEPRVSTVSNAPDHNSFTAPETPATLRPGNWLLPVGLGLLLALAAVLLVWVEMAQPATSFHFKGIRFSNTINSPGATNIVILFRDHLDWIPRLWKD